MRPFASSNFRRSGLALLFWRTRTVVEIMTEKANLRGLRNIDEDSKSGMDGVMSRIASMGVNVATRYAQILLGLALFSASI